MLSAQRDPVPGLGTPDISSSPRPNVASHRPVAAPAFTRFIAGVQLLGTMLAVPVGLASGYSIYRANFSPVAHCGALRANIISMLDKQADASTLRLLIRRDVATFERSCALVDPDAVAAFKTLLEKPVKAVTAHPDTKRASEPRSESGKRAVAKAATAKPADTKRVQSESDADWLAEVRRALVKEEAATRTLSARTPLPTPVATHPAGQPLPVPTQAAPPLAPTASIGVAPAPRAQDERSADHPVPPAPIPNVGSTSAR